MYCHTLIYFHFSLSFFLSLYLSFSYVFTMDANTNVHVNISAESGDPLECSECNWWCSYWRENAVITISIYCSLHHHSRGDFHGPWWQHPFRSLVNSSLRDLECLALFIQLACFSLECRCRPSFFCFSLYSFFLFPQFPAFLKLVLPFCVLRSRFKAILLE